MKYIYAGLLLFIVLKVAVTIFYSLRYGISPMPTSPIVKKKVKEVLPRRFVGTIYELGAGWGTLAFVLAKRYPNEQVLAYEISPVPFLFMKLRNLIFRYRNLCIFRADFRKVNLNDADMIVCYLFPAAMRDLQLKFEKELRPGTIVVTHTFAVPGWKPLKIEWAYDLYHTPVYIYQKP